MGVHFDPDPCNELEEFVIPFPDSRVVDVVQKE
jgi:hypothetical protein